ncbi:MAG TPA: carboxylating nicotinate-nucleotide diphosphorylase [Dehalococcoidia bacterium]|nr:carboxylating nicotinate-nucleotide diphosphorylase [Dehalococcoidia bacterium]
MDEILQETQVEEIIDRALAEDLGQGDVTTEALIPADQEGIAHLVAKGAGILAGLGLTTKVFQKVDAELKVEELVSDGTKVTSGDRVAVVRGKVSSILRAERVALNFLQHLSGIATETARYVDAVSGTKALIMDTRKTIPGLRMLEKYAVRVGGGKNHRLNLGDSILIKDNHLVALRSRGVGLGEAVRKARKQAPERLKVEVEVESIDQAEEALFAGAEVIMLDNMSLEEMQQVVELAQGRAMLEASGGITLENVRAVAETGVDLISIGALTHSVKALDISLEIEFG